MMYSKLDINRNIKTTDTHARDMHMFFFSKSSFTQYTEVTKPWSAAPTVYSEHHRHPQWDSQEPGAERSPEKAT